MNKLRWLCLPVLLVGCASTQNQGALYSRDPRSILVLPPINETAEVTASDQFLSTVTRPLAEAGFYVFPVAVVDRLMKENGLPTPGDMHTAPLAKLHEVFGADTVMYIRILHWGAVPGGTGVKLDYRLVDCSTGAELWKNDVTLWENNSAGGGSPLGALVSLAAATVVGEILGPSQDLVRRANDAAFNTSRDHLLRGPHHRSYDKERTEFAAQAASVASAE